MSERSPANHTEEQLVAHEIATAREEGREISDAAARMIAHWARGLRGSALRAFEETGAIDRNRITDEYAVVYGADDISDFERLTLDTFSTYVIYAEGIDEAGNRGPVDGWDERTQWKQA